MTGAGSDGVAMQERVSSWVYDEQARAILSVKGPLPAADPVAGAAAASAPSARATGKPDPSAVRGLQQVNLDFSTPGQTVLVNSLGQKTVYRWDILAGAYRLLEAVGPGCATCGETNVRYRYDDRGRLTATTRLDAQGQPTRSRQVSFDAMSRPLQVLQVRLVKGKPVVEGWVRGREINPRGNAR